MQDYIAGLDDSQVAAELRALTAKRLDAELDRYRGRVTAAWRPADFIQAHGDVVATLAGRPPADLHPLAAGYLANGRAPSLLDMTRDFMAATLGDHVRAWDDRQIMGAGVGTDHLGNVLADTANRACLSRGSAAPHKALRITRAVEVADYRPSTVSALELDAELPAPSTGLTPWQTLGIAGSGETLQVGMVPLRIRWSEQLRVNDDVRALLRHVEAADIAARQSEDAAVFGILEANPTLSDGSALFVDTVNSVALGVLTDLGLGSGLSMLRSATINGRACDADPAYLICPASKEVDAIKAVRAASPEGRPLVEVLATPHVTHLYVLANPDQWPVLARGTLRASGGQALRWSPGTPTERDGTRDIILQGMHTVGFAAVSRVGVTRVTLS